MTSFYVLAAAFEGAPFTGLTVDGLTEEIIAVAVPIDAQADVAIVAAPSSLSPAELIDRFRWGSPSDASQVVTWLSPDRTAPVTVTVAEQDVSRIVDVLRRLPEEDRSGIVRQLEADAGPPAAPSEATAVALEVARSVAAEWAGSDAASADRFARGLLARLADLNVSFTLDG